MGQGFQFVPGHGMVPLGESVPTSSTPQAPIAMSAPPRERETEPLTKTTSTLHFDPSRPMTGKELLTVAKARVKEIDRQLRAMPILQAERTQLAALIVAASPRKPKSAPRGSQH